MISINSVSAACHAHDKNEFNISFSFVIAHVPLFRQTYAQCVVRVGRRGVDAARTASSHSLILSTTPAAVPPALLLLLLLPAPDAMRSSSRSMIMRSSFDAAATTTRCARMRAPSAASSSRSHAKPLCTA